MSLLASQGGLGKGAGGETLALSGGVVHTMGTGLGSDRATPFLKVPLAYIGLVDLLPTVQDCELVCSEGQEARFGFFALP